MILSAGCGVLPAVGPDYAGPPALNVPEKWATQSPADCRVQDLGNWWKVLADERLNTIIAKALDANRNLQIAESRVREVKHSRAAAFGSFFPQIGIGGNIARGGISKNTQQGRLFGGDVQLPIPDLRLETTVYSGALDASWEIDLFGGLRRSYEAADATVDSTSEQLNDVLVSLIAEVASNYYEVQALEKRLSIARENIRIQSESLDIVDSRVRAGLGSELDLAQARGQLEVTKATLPALEAAMVGSRSRLAVLLGETLAGLDPLFPRQQLSKVDLIVKDLPQGLLQGIPSEILRNRPDIRIAERNLATQTALVGVATADLFPKFTLTGSLGLQSLRTGDFFDAASKTWSIGPGVSLPIFTAGKLTAQLRAQGERATQAASRYEQTVLSALAEGETRIAAFEQEKTRFQTLKRSYDANIQAVSLSRELYEKGLADFLRVIEAQRQLFVVEDVLAQSEQAMVSNLIASYKALGYGWQESPAEPRKAETVQVSALP